MQAITAQNLSKYFQISPSSKGIKRYFSLEKKWMAAVDDISFVIQPGEKVAFIGPNGAGKSTTIKMLTGIIQPTSGHIEILGKNPIKDRKKLAYEISAVFGNSSKLWHHLSIEKSYALLAMIYDISDATFQQRLDLLVDKFQIKPLLTKLARQLSLGERMRCELVASFLHRPKIILLDEPTIGLDAIAKSTIRDLLCTFSKEEGTTLLLTSHDTDDIELVATRVIMLNKGKIILDNSLYHMQHYIQKKTIEVITEEELGDYRENDVRILERKNPHHMKLEVDLQKTSCEKILKDLIHRFNIRDLNIEDPSLETIIKNIYVDQNSH